MKTRKIMAAGCLALVSATTFAANAESVKTMDVIDLLVD